MKYILLLVLIAISNSTLTGVGSLGSVRLQNLLLKKSLSAPPTNSEAPPTPSPEASRTPVPIRGRPINGFQCKSYGWFKYIKYTKDNQGKQGIRGFIINSDFERKNPDIANLDNQISMEPNDLKRSQLESKKKQMIDSLVKKSKATDAPTYKGIIPDNTSFFVQVCGIEVDLFQDRDSIDSLKDFIRIREILPVPENNVNLGGIRPNPQKLAEGYCIKIKSKKPQGELIRPVTGLESNLQTISKPEFTIEEVYVLCTDDGAKQAELAKDVIDKKIRIQRRDGEEISIKPGDANKEIQTIVAPPHQEIIDLDQVGTQTNTALNQFMKEDVKDSKSCKVKVNEQNGGESIFFGTLKLLQDFGPCTVICGGGEMVKQYTCCANISLDNKNGDAQHCSGSYIQKKLCNEKPCTIVPVEKKLEKKDLEEKVTVETKPAIVKLMRISSNPLRYDKCHLKEGDSLLTMNRINKMIVEPARIVMNEDTISAYKDEVK